MSKRSLVWYRLWTALVFASSIFWALWRWVPRFALPPGRQSRLGASLWRASETVCTLDTALHDCNMTLEGSCPADVQRERVTGLHLDLGPLTMDWPPRA